MIGMFSIYLSSLISFSKDVQFSLYKSCISSVRFIPKYFIHPDATVNVIISLILPSLYYSLLVYRNTTNFCMLFVSCPFDEFISSNCVCVQSLFFSPYKTMSSVSREDFFFLSNLDALITFFFLPNCSIQNFHYYFEWKW